MKKIRIVKIIEELKKEQKEKEKLNVKIIEELKKEQNEKEKLNVKIIEELKKEQNEKEKLNVKKIEELKKQNKKEIEELKKRNEKEIEDLKKVQKEKEEQNKKEIEELKKRNEILYKKFQEFSEEMKKLNYESNINKKINDDKEKIDIKNDKLNEIKPISVKNEIENKINNKDKKNEKENEKRVSYNNFEKTIINDTDQIYLDILNKIRSQITLSNKENDYLRLYYIFRAKCIEENINDCSIVSLIENHAKNKKICEIFHSIVQNGKFSYLKEYDFKKCSNDDCPVQLLNNS